MKKRIIPFIVIIVSFLVQGCFSPKGIQYFTEYSEKDVYSLTQREAPIIKPNDHLYITVKSYNEYDITLLSGSQNEMRITNSQSTHLIGYNVDDDGYLNYPVAGMVKVSGLTLHEAEKLLESKLMGFFTNPNVSIKFLSKTITILGEVNRPGQYEFTKDHINIFQALGLASDLTESGNRKEVIIFRQNEDELKRGIINLKDQETLVSEYFYIKPNDIIYVKPTTMSRWRIITNSYTLLLTTTTTVLVVIDRINR